ncbi:NAD(P)-binding protein [Daldinia caldariorum]|uniref:NAD(P)-binding protein n=1 Tax=Daldinia caldariorum TaxID=326644 RepID=UPI002008AF3F|nr:NAD(P)-binding protein [Daldinia caldariorum]KAI1470381.1 NAD(P)-binding protein [Daldinia caldariorum]
MHILTGSGIGRACALLFAKEGAAGVMVADLAVDAANDVVAECKAVATNSQFQAEAIQVDITQEDSVRRLMGRMIDVFKRMDYCVNCAGIGVQKAVDIAGMSLAEFQRFLDVNTVGMFLVTREASITMRAQEPQAVSQSSPGRGTTRGAIVNLGSGSSMIATPGVLPYTASKHAALGLSKNSALDNASHGIRVNCVCPSWTDTPMVREAMSGVEGLSKFIETAVPIGRIAMPEEVADAVIFLCSPRSSYVTGCGFLVDGGTTLTALR